MMIPERQKTNDMSTLIAPGYCLEKVSKMYQNKGNPGIAQWSPSTVSSERQRQVEFARPAAEEERAAKRERTLEICRGSPLSLISECVGEKHLRPRKEAPKKIRRNDS